MGWCLPEVRLPGLKMVDVAQSVEQQIVVLRVAGSNPVIHPAHKPSRILPLRIRFAPVLLLGPGESTGTLSFVEPIGSPAERAECRGDGRRALAIVGAELTCTFLQ